MLNCKINDIVTHDDDVDMIESIDDGQHRVYLGTLICEDEDGQELVIVMAHACHAGAFDPKCKIEMYISGVLEETYCES